MKLFLSYIRYHKGVILTYILFSFIFYIVFALYHLPLEAVLYPCGICLLITVMIIIVDFVKARRRYRRLEEIRLYTAAMMEDFPKVHSIEEEEYIQIISLLKKEIRELETTHTEKYSDVIEYYTLWAHQIKTPISSMHLTLQNEDSKAARRISSDLFRIEQYVEMVLTYLRLDSDSSDYVFRECQIDDIIRVSVKKFASEFIGRHLTFVFTPTKKTVVTDEKWLGFVIEQIVSNALKYTREGGVRIYTEKPKILCIEDTGIGIAPEDLPRIFEKGYTGSVGRTYKHSSGIGLYLCKRVCDALGIDIKVESEIDKGTKVLLNLEQYKLRKE